MNAAEVEDAIFQMADQPVHANKFWDSFLEPSESRRKALYLVSENYDEGALQIPRTYRSTAS